jgi:hypothetical protein
MMLERGEKEVKITLECSVGGNLCSSLVLATTEVVTSRRKKQSRFDQWLYLKKEWKVLYWKLTYGIHVLLRGQE